MSVIDPRLAHASTLPARFYTDPEVSRAEHEKIFRRTWQLVGHSQQVVGGGDFFTCEAAGEPLLVVRGSDLQLRAFHNVCRHRAGPPAQGCGTRKVFRCGYHGWTYGLDGQLLAAPEFEGVEDFAHQQFGLVPVLAEEWHGLIFVNFDEGASPLAAELGDLTNQFARFGFPAMRLQERRHYVMDCNWKTYIDNYLEGYHLPSVHPGLNRELEYDSYVTETFPAYVLQSSPIRAAAGDSGRRYEDASGSQAADYFWIFPNWMLNCYPDNISVNIVVPLGPERTDAIFEWYFPPQVLGSEVAARTIRFSDEIQVEDARICETVQRNLRSSSYDRGRYSVTREQGVHHFHMLYSQAMA